MELPDCPPGAEGYQDSIAIELPKKPSIHDSSTKAEQEFKEHLNSLKIKAEDGSVRCMVERRGRDVSGKWIYVCFPCAAMCSGESILQTHISGKKHKAKLSMRTSWPLEIFEDREVLSTLHNEKRKKGEATEELLQKMAEEVQYHNKNNSELSSKYGKYKNVVCHIQDVIDNVKAPLLGLEYLVEHPPEQAHYEPSYMCTLCSKQGHPRTIVNHLTCFWHRYNYLIRHFNKACTLLTPYRTLTKYREGVSVIMNRLAQRIEDKYGRLKPKHIDKEEYDKDKDNIHKWIFNDFHFSENAETTFEEVVDVELILNLSNYNEPGNAAAVKKSDRGPSPPVVAAPSRPHIRQRERRSSLSLSDVSDDEPRRKDARDYRHPIRDKDRRRVSPYHDKRRPSPPRARFAAGRNATGKDKDWPAEKVTRPPNYEYKVKLAMERREAAEAAMKKTLAYHEKNPEKHPLYPEEWKKFWNRRYKEIQAEGKDPSKHDFKPEWIVFWTARMKKLHEEELRTEIVEHYRKLRLTPPDERTKSPEPRRRSIERKRSLDRRRSPLDFRKRPDRRPSPGASQRPLEPRRLPLDHRRDRRTPEYRRSPARHSSPPPSKRSRSPLYKFERRSPLSRRSPPRNRSPQPRAVLTVLVSDDELQPENISSPWNSDNDVESLGSLPDARSPVRSRSRTGSVASRPSHTSHVSHALYRRSQASAADLGPAENIVATLRLLVALEDHLGSLGPKVIDLLTEALKMEKDSANSSEELLERESAVVLIETAKEKLKGAMQAGLVSGAAAAAARTAVVRAAATLHAADARRHRFKSSSASKTRESVSMPVAGVGAVDRAEIAQQMAAALIAQGKTNVSSEELAQLVDAVVGMAEAKKRESESKKKVELRATAEKASKAPLSNAAKSASALQMLQSAYDEYDKKIEKEEAPDAMDGLSDSDLETLLKNFSELSAEEQHSLIAYLKKLEAKEPHRVEKLRQYVTAAGTVSASKETVPIERPPVVQEKEFVSNNPVAIESDDDDDYTVEEVFNSATQKVKEDQIRQEMEIVKKSLEETKPAPAAADPDLSFEQLTNSLTSASDLLALVHASIQAGSVEQATPTPQQQQDDLQPDFDNQAQDGFDPRHGTDRHLPLVNQDGSDYEENQDIYGGGRFAPNRSRDNFGNHRPLRNQGNGGNFGSQGNSGNFGSQINSGNFGNQGNSGNFGSQGSFGNFGNQGNFSNASNSSDGTFSSNDRSNFKPYPNQGNYQMKSNQGNFGTNFIQGNYDNLNQGNFGNNSNRGFGGRQNLGNVGGNKQNQGNFGGNQNNFSGPKPLLNNFGNNQMHNNFGNIQGNFARGRGGRGQRGRGRGGYY